MTSFTTTWNSAFEGQPADTEDLSLGAGRMRTLKESIRERLAVDHSIAGDADDGAHLQLTLKKQTNTTPPAGYARLGVEVDGLLSLMSSSGVETTFYPGGFPAGTKMLFMNGTAPTGWVLDAAFDDRMVGIHSELSGSVGGSHTWYSMTVVPSHTHTLSGTTQGEAQTHTHTYTDRFFIEDAAQSPNNPGAGVLSAGGGSYKGSGGVDSDNENFWYVSDNTSGQNIGHTHGFSTTTDGNSGASNWNPRYALAMVATKS